MSGRSSRVRQAGTLNTPSASVAMAASASIQV